MKKLLFGLILTIGLSSVSYASVATEKYEFLGYKESDHDKVIVKKIIQSTNSKEVALVYVYYGTSCTISHITKWYDSCGNYVSSDVDYSYTASGSACGSNEGGIIMKVSRMNTGFGDCWVG